MLSLKMVLGALLGMCVCGTAMGAQTPRGLWLLPRKDAQNTARADVAGDMKTAPREVWSYGGGGDVYSYARPVRVGGHAAYFVQERSGVQLVRADGVKVWNRPVLGISGIVAVLDFGGASNSAALTTTGNSGFLLLDIATGKTLWSWSLPVNTYLIGYKTLREGERTRLFVFPQDTLQGFCFEFRKQAKQPRLLWHKEYQNDYWQNYGPSIILADMDHDGKPDLVVAGKPGYLGVIDSETGAMKFDLHYDVPGADHFGRPYGLLQVGDMDGDGYPDVVMVSCQVEQYIAVIHNEKGKGLRLAWAQFVEKDFPDDFKDLQPNVTSLADLRGDGKKSLVLGIYNMDGDNRWHTLVFDGMKGFRARLADLPDRYFWGCYDLNGDGREEIVTSTQTTRRPADVTTLQAVDGRTFKDIATVEKAALPNAGLPLPADTAFLAQRPSPAYLTQPNGVRGLLLKRSAAKGEELWHLADGHSVFTAFAPTPLARVALFSESSGKIGRLDMAIKGAHEKPLPMATGALVSEAEGQRELIFSLSDGTIIGGVPDLAHSGHFKKEWRIPGTTPAVWIGPDGRRVVCAVDPDGQSLTIQQPSFDRQETDKTVRVKLPWPVYRTGWTRSGGTLLPFGDEEMRLFVGLQRGTHALACEMLDADGHVLWHDDEDGPYPRSAAIYASDGKRDDTVFVDDHGKQFLYNMQGKGRLIAEGWNNTVPGRSDGAKYALPIVGPYGPNGSLRLVLSPGLDALEILDPSGARVAKSDYAEHYEFQWCGAAPAQIRGKGVWDLGMVNGQGIFHCADIATAQTRWTMDMGTKATLPINVVSGDIDGDGRDNFLVGLPNGELLALDEKDGHGVVLWKVVFPASIKEAIMADVDGDGRAEIIVETDDGKIRILK